MTGEADIQENRLEELSPDLLNTLLKDHTTSKEGKQCNIFWATSDYESLGKGYEYGSPILPELITGENGNVVMPRVLKHRDTQSMRPGKWLKYSPRHGFAMLRTTLSMRPGSVGRTCSTMKSQPKMVRIHGKSIRIRLFS